MRPPKVAEPARLALRPHDRHGRPVPYFAVQTGPGEWDFRVADGGALHAALKHGLCWVCGFPFLRQEDRAFVIGPMCAVNRTSAEPPSHEECGIYSARVCPFLATPRMARRTRHLPGGTESPGGVMIERNPGVTLVWVTRYNGWGIKHREGSKRLFDIGDPLRATWWAEGRAASRAEVLESITTGLPALEEMAGAQGEPAKRELARLITAITPLFPAEAA